MFVFLFLFKILKKNVLKQIPQMYYIFTKNIIQRNKTWQKYYIMT
jgi:hypothetical protein